jgi:DNA-binding transcriptional LysR family regulator
MDLNLVAAFVRVVEEQSFTGAAKALGLPKSSVSRRVTELEEQLGVRLLHRTTRKLALTEAGRAYFEQAERALAELDAAAAAAAGMDAEPRGIVRLTVPVDLAVMGLAKLLAEFSRMYPDIHVELSLSSRVVNLLEEGFDLAVRAGGSSDPSLVARTLGAVELGLYASSEYLQRRGRPKLPEDLLEHDCVLFRARNGRTLWRLDGPANEVASIEVTGHVSVDELLFVQSAVDAGLGIGLLPPLVTEACQKAGKLGRLERVLPEYGIRGGELRIVAASGVKRPKRVTLLRDFLVQRFLPHASWDEPARRARSAAPGTRPLPVSSTA